MIERESRSNCIVRKALDAVAAGARPVRLSARQSTGRLHSAALHRFTAAMARQSMLQEGPISGGSALGARLIRLVRSAGSRVPLASIARPRADELVVFATRTAAAAERSSRPRMIPPGD